MNVSRKCTSLIILINKINVNNNNWVYILVYIYVTCSSWETPRTQSNRLDISGWSNRNLEYDHCITKYFFSNYFVGSSLCLFVLLETPWDRNEARKRCFKCFFYYFVYELGCNDISPNPSKKTMFLPETLFCFFFFIGPEGTFLNMGF